MKSEPIPESKRPRKEEREIMETCKSCRRTTISFEAVGS